MAETTDKTYYEVLGVDSTATTDDIKKEFKKLARKHHPDAGGDETVFKGISEAYEVLSDKEKRAEYDKMLKYGAFTAAGGAWGGQGGPWTANGRGGSGAFSSLSDILNSMASGEGAFGTDWEFGKKKTKGQDIQVTLEVSFEEAFKGTEKRVTVKSSDNNNQTIDVKVPQGAVEGGKLRYKGKGALGSNGGVNGDLLIVTAIKPHELYRRSGAHVLMDLPLSLDEAVLGAQIMVPAPDGTKVKLTVPAGTQDGNVFLVKGKGAKRLGSKAESSEYGDLKIKAALVVPQELNDAQKEALEAFAKASSYEILRGWEV